MATIEFRDRDLLQERGTFRRTVGGHLLRFEPFSVPVPRNGDISTSGPKFVVTIVLSNVSFLKG